MLPKVVLDVISNYSWEKRKGMEDQVGFCGSGLGVDFLPHSLNQNSVTRPHLTAGENGTCALAVCHRGKRHRKPVISLSHQNDLEILSFLKFRNRKKNRKEILSFLKFLFSLIIWVMRKYNPGLDIKASFIYL